MRLNQVIILLITLFSILAITSIVSSQNCMDVYSPVCGTNNVTYSNSCYANNANVQIACEKACPCSDNNLIPPITSCTTSERTTTQYCGTDKQLHIQKSNNNSCSYSYECQSNNCETNKCQAVCIDVYSPVCGVNNKTYSNSCYAQRENVEVKCEKACPCAVTDPIPKKCSDGTLYGECSITKPKYCNNGTLINKCSLCGCYSNQTCQLDGSCSVITPTKKCSDGTLYGECSINKPKYCNNGTLIDKCSLCGCPQNKTCQSNGGCGDILPIPKPNEAYFKFDIISKPGTFIFKLSNLTKINKARGILNGTVKDAIHVKGLIVQEPVNYNPPWSYHLDPDSVDFFQYAIEVCDTEIIKNKSAVEEYCSQFPPGKCLWCPWASRLLEEVNISNITPKSEKSIELSKSGEIFSIKTKDSTTIVKSSEGLTRKLTTENEKLFVETSNGRKAEIKIMPETASQIAKERLGELGFNIELKEVGKDGDESKIIYSLEGEKNSKLFGFINKKARIIIQIDAETGEIIKIKKPWWSFLAR